jgi:hypothetical protein
MNENEARLGGIRALESKGYGVRDVTSGQGRPKFSIVELDLGGSRQTCSIKVANHPANSRISYPVKEGKFSVLSDVDLVLHIRPMADGSIRSTMFSKATVLAAFEENRKALIDAGKGHLPVWVSPEKEPSSRLVGSGFGAQALWSVSMLPSGSSATAASVVDKDHRSTHVQPLSITEAKMAVAAKYGVLPENVEIIVRG